MDHQPRLRSKWCPRRATDLQRLAMPVRCFLLPYSSARREPGGADFRRAHSDHDDGMSQGEQWERSTAARRHEAAFLSFRATFYLFFQARLLFLSAETIATRATLAPHATRLNFPGTISAKATKATLCIGAIFLAQHLLACSFPAKVQVRRPLSSFRSPFVPRAVNFPLMALRSSALMLLFNPFVYTRERRRRRA